MINNWNKFLVPARCENAEEKQCRTVPHLHINIQIFFFIIVVIIPSITINIFLDEIRIKSLLKKYLLEMNSCLLF